MGREEEDDDKEGIRLCMDCSLTHLQQRKRATCKVKQNVSNRPSDRRLSFPIHVCLWHVLDDRHPQLDVRKVRQPIQPLNLARPSYN